MYIYIDILTPMVAHIKRSVDPNHARCRPNEEASSRAFRAPLTRSMASPSALQEPRWASNRRRHGSCAGAAGRRTGWRPGGAARPAAQTHTQRERNRERARARVRERERERENARARERARARARERERLESHTRDDAMPWGRSR